MLKVRFNKVYPLDQLAKGQGSDGSLTNLLCAFYDFKTLGVQVLEHSCPRSTMSHEDRKTIQLFDSSLAYHGREIPPFCQTTRDTWEACLEIHQGYENNRWARKLSKEQLEAKTNLVFYLAHHGIYRPEKKGTLLRIVFDPACQYQGILLNSFLYNGLCLVGNLLGVLLCLSWRYV